MSGSAIGGAIRLMPPSATVCTSGPGMIMGVVAVKSTVTPAREQARALRTYLRVFRGVHKPYLHLYVAAYDATLNAKRVTPTLIRRMAVCTLSAHTGYT